MPFDQDDEAPRLKICDLYPRVSPNTLFHRYPNAHVSLVPENGAGARRISRDVYEALAYCDRTCIARHIADMLLGDGCIDEREEFYMFLAESMTEGVLQLSSLPRPVKLELSGSFERWLPERVLIELTERCNLACEYCYGSYGTPARNARSLSRFSQALPLLSKMGVHTVELSGGEPTLHPDFHSIFEYCLKEFRAVGLLSNGIKFSDDILLLSEKHKEKLTVQISIDGSHEAVNARVRRKSGTFDPTLNTIRQLIAIDVPLRVGFVATPNNVDDVLPTCELLRGVGVKQIALSAAYGLGRGVGLNLLGNGKTLPCTKQVVNLFDGAYQQYADVVLNPQSEWARESAERMENCGGGCKNFVLSATGEVKPCPVLPTECGTLGNLFNDEYVGMFNDSALAKTCQRFAVRTEEPACGACEYNQNCGKCLARVMLATMHRNSRGRPPCEIAERCSLTSGFSLVADIAFEIQAVRE